MEKTLTIKLVKSSITAPKNQKDTLKALGLTKINKTVVKVDNPQIRGMIRTVAHLVSVEEA
ncbi:MAG: 50S ribosomal protein L30 [Bacilli bacterium]|mgnify:FL=1|jgi:large subunit ribosomal protein L30|nr:50S ribosomal protein L30 [Bacilli bacterium]HHU24127.1 50S ribosomal protein L30 [Acholeplasmataceae bacterium]